LCEMIGGVQNDGALNAGVATHRQTRAMPPVSSL
jgi:hypothetical protein